MKIIQNKFIPFGSYLAMTIGPFIFTKNKTKINDTVLRHETIHYYQQAELGYIIFFIFYFLSFITQLIRCSFNKEIGQIGNYRQSVWDRAYRTILFEREAYEHENDETYLDDRAPWAWFLLNFYV